MWINAAKGIPPPDYDGTHEFTDMPGGTYKIFITSSAGTGFAQQVIILSKGWIHHSKKCGQYALRSSGKS